MGNTVYEEVTRHLTRLRSGDREAAEELLPLVYNELRALAQSYLAHRPGGATLQATSIVHEVYLRLVDQTNVDWESRAHFFAVAAKAMQQLLVDHVRRSGAQKRGGGAQRVAIDALSVPDEQSSVALLDLEESLSALAELDPFQAQIVELRFYGGLSFGEVAQVLGVSKSTVEREWRTARAWLISRLGQAGEGKDDSGELPSG
jgi:RNA polymerase sigma factor (TIGR02999 family)